jgi:hypothetical protein
VLEVAIIRDTISHYSPVLIATLSNQFPRAGVQKKRAHRRRGQHPLLLDRSAAVVAAKRTLAANGGKIVRGRVLTIKKSPPTANATLRSCLGSRKGST